MRSLFRLVQKPCHNALIAVSMLWISIIPIAIAQVSSSTRPSQTKYIDDARLSVLRYLRSIEGKQSILGIENKNMSTPTADTDRVFQMAGKMPGLWGADFGFGHGAVDHRQTMADEALRQWKKGAVVSLMYHACPPTMNEFCSWDDIGGKHPIHLSDAEWESLVTHGTALNHVWLARLDTLAAFLQQLQDAGAIVLFRPFHEMNQCRFWWACHKGNDGTAHLYDMTHDYLTNTKGLKNIIWVWNVQDFTSLAQDVDAYRPSSPSFDIASLDIYEKSGYSEDKYRLMQQAAYGKPIAVGECRFYPTIETIRSQSEWIYFMLWPDFIDENQKEVPSLFAQPQIVTRDHMPAWHTH